MLSAKDIRGVCAMIPTPCKEGGDHWSATDTVDLDETARMVDLLVQAGIGTFAICGTTGEGWGLTMEEKQAFTDTVIQVNRHRVPVFAGTTALGTREVVSQMRLFKDMGAEGAFMGLPMWERPTLSNSVRFYADLSEALPDFPVMIYANSRMFKWDFPTEFWEGIARQAPTSVCCKIAYPITHLADDHRVAGHQVNFMPNEGATLAAHEATGHNVTAIWSTSVAMGPEPSLALMDAILSGDEQRIQTVNADLKALPPTIPPGKEDGFASFNAQGVKMSVNAAGYVKAGPMRGPYYDLPDDWAELAVARGRAWAELRKKYAKVTP